MNQVLQRVLAGTNENHLLSFFWQHGEDENTLRTYMRVISEANIGAVCVESRPHPDFCGPRWWHDMDIILDEARKRNMKVWILDDSHFPTGYANGAMKSQPDERCRKSIYRWVIDCKGKFRVELGKNKLAHAAKVKRSIAEKIVLRNSSINGGYRKFYDDRLLSVSAIRSDEKNGEIINLTEEARKNSLEWHMPTAGEWKVYIIHSTGNAGYHPMYINMMDEKSCRILIDAVYEPHYTHYKDDFGKTIAGFFSDEPELGNGHLWNFDNPLGTDQDLPWSGELEDRLREKWGIDFEANLALLWENVESNRTAQVRYTYMDTVTRLVEKDFSHQIGGWCRAHGVEYIGHVIEDKNAHARTGCSLGHFFRGMSGQDMAGIDDIGNQVFPQGEDLETSSKLFGLFVNRDGEFFHYALGKLGVSLAAIDPIKKGRCMCEIFGNYGWEEGVRLEKYLADHFLVRGVNYYVPHAFSPKKFPDPDCPPHFYAHGHNPQYRHFGVLMAYMNRVCSLISGGHRIAPIAVLYHGEAEWAGPCMLTQKPCRLLADAQIDHDIIPQDVFTEQEKYRTVLGSTLKVNTQEYHALVVPTSSYITTAFAEAVVKLKEAGFPVIFVNEAPVGLCDSTNDTATILENLRCCPIIPLDELIPFLREKGIFDISITPANNRIRYLRYAHDDGAMIYYFINEGTESWRGVIAVPEKDPCVAYNAWDNRLETIRADQKENGTELAVEIEPLKILIVAFDEALPSFLPKAVQDPVTRSGFAITLTDGWKRSICAAIDYPKFSGEIEINLPDNLAEEQKRFSGFVRYEKTFFLEEQRRVVLEIIDAHEGVEVFVNGVSMGIQIAPPFRYDITALVKLGDNGLVIEVATTLERCMGRKGRWMKKMYPTVPAQSGITGAVNLYTMKEEI
jgi:hypothetical protein